MKRWHKILIGIAAALLAAWLIALVAARPAPASAWGADAPRRPLVMVHQGGDGLWPGDTLYAFERAAELGVDVLEMDIHMTADGVIVTMHDSTVDRTTDGAGAISEMTYAEISMLDAGYDWSPEGGETTPYRGQGISVPRLEDIFAAFPDYLMNIEIKQEEPSLAEPFCALIREYGMADRVLVASFHDAAIREFRAVCPEVATSAAMNETIVYFALETAFLGATYSPPAFAVQVPEYRSGLHVLTPRFVNVAQRRGMQVHVWTVNEEADMRRMIALGVDGIITDYPDRLLAVLEE
jgi:glycerophosphoryl diester phosphodiesterase